MDLPPRVFESLLRLALEEDIGGGDVTTGLAVDSAAEGVATVVARETGVLAGSPLALRVFELLDPSVEAFDRISDGTRLAAGTRILVLRGRARALLSGERTALNFLGRLSGIATLTARFVEAVGGGPVRILDTRKTTPGLRALERYAVAVGGGTNHRAGLHDAVLLKSNHYALAGGDVEAIVARARSGAPSGVPVLAEARTREEALAAVRGGASVVLLDNFEPGPLREAVAAAREEARRRDLRVEFEASGGVRLDNVRAYAEAGVDRISVGALTRSAPWLDVAMRCAPGEGGRAR
ncbi:MAG TPA: carboxylating nicotinate-nucleotide diphosphorylase [Planctomycetota bacterium]|jgi:nicotinate-nucleotide pyrophosphorylase (carboxylating)|nr:carboxylating nicotinate-nucleotide diphosphorylase [Planctomycetota bacterium]